jgi:SAM-dependent MidA family methyltransferase
MGVALRSLIVRRIRDRGPLTVSAFMEMALYHPELGYYTGAPRRTGRGGDFYTSVDVGPQFGALLAAQIDEMRQVHAADGASGFDLVEAGAGNGQLARDVLDAAESAFPALHAATRLTLVETSPAARTSQPETLGSHRGRLQARTVTLPDGISGVILANELLDALPTHAVAMTADGLREVFVDLDGDRFVERVGAPSTPALGRHLARLGVTLEPGWRGEVNLAAIDWVRTAARRLTRGFLLLIDYGHSARELYAGSHANGTLTTFHRHRVDATGADPEQPDGPAWLANPGERDITSHVDFTAVRQAARDDGLDVLGFVDQTRFLLGLGALDTPPAAPDGAGALRHRLALKTLLVPGGLGSTHQVLILGKGVGRPALKGCSFTPRETAS